MMQTLAQSSILYIGCVAYFVPLLNTISRIILVLSFHICYSETSVTLFAINILSGLRSVRTFYCLLGLRSAVCNLYWDIDLIMIIT